MKNKSAGLLKKRIVKLEKRVANLEKNIPIQEAIPVNLKKSDVPDSGIDILQREKVFCWVDAKDCRKTWRRGATLRVYEDGNWETSVTAENTSKHRKFRLSGLLYITDENGKRLGEIIPLMLGNIGHRQTSTWNESGRNIEWGGDNFDRVVSGNAYMSYDCVKR